MTARGASGTIHSRSLTVDHTQVPSTQTNFTVLVSFTNSTLKTIANGGHVQRSDGFDIIFTSDSAGVTRLKWEMESYDGTNGIVVAWVKIASLSSVSDTVFYMFYGDASITTDQSDKANTWDTNFIEVWHMDDNAASTAIVASIGSNATNVANTSTKTTTGQINNALSYNGTTDGSSVAVNFGTNRVVTLSFWLNWTTNLNDDDLAFEYTNNFNAKNGFIVNPNSSSLGGVFEIGMSQGASYWTDSVAQPSTATWRLVHVVFDRGTPVNKLYFNGSAQTLTAGPHTLIPNDFDNSSLYFMSRGTSSLNGAGSLDEVKVSITERSADWVTCEWNNQKTSSTFIALGSET